MCLVTLNLAILFIQCASQPVRICTNQVVQLKEALQEQVSGATEASWTAAKASVDGALERLDALVAAQLRARIVGELLPVVQASQLHSDLNNGRENDKGHLRAAPTAAQPLQVRFKTCFAPLSACM